MNPEVSRVLKNTIILLENCLVPGKEAAALAEAIAFLTKLWTEGQAQAQTEAAG